MPQGDVDKQTRRDQANDDARDRADDAAAQQGEAAESPEAAESREAAEQPQSELDALRAELESWRDRALRLQADSENFRKRIQREREEERRYAAMSLLRDLLGVRDNLLRAMESAAAAPEANSLLEGVRMVAEQLTALMDRHGCREVPAEGASFDPDVHEAITSRPSEEHPAGTVAQVLQTGYQLHDRVVRPAQVIVSTGPPEPEGTKSDGEPPEGDDSPAD